ncbi:MAG: toxin-antitoxin system YwqK family antitoxin [Cetobacterium sp.]|uniref:toxin-antitoxin system YwqK family antitoxin n=1 Tax=Cetobacterium sp. TaxID=2071632 RepID=UPI003F35A832
MMKKISIAFILLVQITFARYSQVEYSKILNKNGKIFVKNNRTPFTGMVTFQNDREFYKNGVPEGKWLSFYTNGKIKSIENWRNGELNGKYVLYSQDGHKTFQTYYLKGKDHGLFRLYHENGKPHIVGNFNNGQAIGIWNYYNQNGKLIGKREYTIDTNHFDQTN